MFEPNFINFIQNLKTEEERKLAYINIDKCLILCLENNIKHLSWNVNLRSSFFIE